MGSYGPINLVLVNSLMLRINVERRNICKFRHAQTPALSVTIQPILYPYMPSKEPPRLGSINLRVSFDTPDASAYCILSRCFISWPEEEPACVPIKIGRPFYRQAQQLKNDDLYAPCVGKDGGGCTEYGSSKAWPSSMDLRRSKAGKESG